MPLTLGYTYAWLGSIHASYSSFLGLGGLSNYFSKSGIFLTLGFTNSYVGFNMSSTSLIGSSFRGEDCFSKSTPGMWGITG